MSQEVFRKPITYYDVEEREANDQRFEIVDGEWIASELGTILHGSTGASLISSLAKFIKDEKLGLLYSRVAYVLDGSRNDIRTMYIPDVSFVLRERLVTDGDPDDYYYQAPDLAVDMIMAHEKVGHLRRKLSDLLKAGTKQVWLVYLNTKQIDVHLPDGTTKTYGIGQIIPGGDLLPGFELDLAKIFKE